MRRGHARTLGRTCRVGHAECVSVAHVFVPGWVGDGTVSPCRGANRGIRRRAVACIVSTSFTTGHMYKNTHRRRTGLRAASVVLSLAFCLLGGARQAWAQPATITAFNGV